MKNCFRKIIAILIVSTFVLGFSVPAFAGNLQASPQRIDFVATVTVVSYAGPGLGSSVGYSGHSFLVVRNDTSSQITVGHFPVAPGASITLGTFGNRSAHVGIWYNIEGHYSSLLPTSYGLVTSLTASQLTTFNSKINANDTWSLTKNCSYFAQTVWNSIASSSYQISGGNPAALQGVIASKANYVTNPSVPSKTIGSIARHTKTSYVFDSSGA